MFVLAHNPVTTKPWFFFRLRIVFSFINNRWIFRGILIACVFLFLKSLLIFTGEKFFFHEAIIFTRREFRLSGSFFLKERQRLRRSLRIVFVSMHIRVLTFAPKSESHQCTSDQQEEQSNDPRSDGQDVLVRGLPRHGDGQVGSGLSIRGNDKGAACGDIAKSHGRTRGGGGLVKPHISASCRQTRRCARGRRRLGGCLRILRLLARGGRRRRRRGRSAYLRVVSLGQKIAAVGGNTGDFSVGQI